jgi:hypothetical protein
MNTWSAPGWVLRCHAENQISNLLRNSLSADTVFSPGE